MEMENFFLQRSIMANTLKGMASKNVVSCYAYKLEPLPMKFLLFFAVCCISFLMGCSVHDKQDQEEYDLVITNVNLIDGTGGPMSENVTIGIRGGRISKIGAGFIGESKQTIEGGGKFLIPGLFDCHAHTTDFERDFPRFIHYGVTSILVPGGSLCTNEYYAKMTAKGNQDKLPAPFVFHTSQHFSMEGRHPSKTYGSDNWRDGESIFYLRDTVQIADIMKNVSQFPHVGIKLTIEDGPHPPFVSRMPFEFVEKTVREARKYNFEVFAHVSDNVELEMAIRAGVQNLLHYTGVNIDPADSLHMKLINQFSTLNPSWVTTFMIDKSFIYPIHPEWFDNPSLLPEYRVKREEITLEQEEIARLWVESLREQSDLESDDFDVLISPFVRDVQFLSDQGINMVLGTDTGNTYNFPGYSLHEEMQIFEKGGMDPVEIIRMGTLNAAKMLNAQDTLGSIETGKVANMIILDRNPLETIQNTLAINTVIKNGVIQKRLPD